MASIVAVFGVVVAAKAAVTDGTGPWADYVVSTHQLLRKDGTAVLPERSDPTSALGKAESAYADFEEWVPGTFYSLGFGGEMVLGFVNGIVNGKGDDFRLYEISGPNYYPLETAIVYASKDKVTWTKLGTATRDESFDLGKLPCAKYIKIVDTSNPSLFELAGDGFDVDAVEDLHPFACQYRRHCCCD